MASNTLFTPFQCLMYQPKARHWEGFPGGLAPNKGKQVPLPYVLSQKDGTARGTCRKTRTMLRLGDIQTAKSSTRPFPVAAHGTVYRALSIFSSLRVNQRPTFMTVKDRMLRFRKMAFASCSCFDTSARAERSVRPEVSKGERKSKVPFLNKYNLTEATVCGTCAVASLTHFWDYPPNR